MKRQPPPKNTLGPVPRSRYVTREITKTDEMTVRVIVVLVICALVAVDLVPADLDLNVFYPVEENYSVVRLTCTEVGLDVADAEFLKDGVALPSSNNLVTVTNIGSGEISFHITQQQEGMFSCRSGGGGDESEKIGLAGIKLLKLLFLLQML